jgi:hypothetical protein
MSGDIVKIIPGGLEIKANHDVAADIAKSIMKRPGVTEILSRGNDLSADSERIILAHAYLELLAKRRPWEGS